MSFSHSSTAVHRRRRQDPPSLIAAKQNIKTMTISTAQLNETQKPTCAKKSSSIKKLRGKDAVPFDEMERLMNVYGSIKALRNRGAPKKSKAEQGGNDKKVAVKKDSIKRKFYRWFPDFDERFSKDENGRYQPVHGHDFEVKYRQEMRQKSMTDVSAKRSDAITKKKYVSNTIIAPGKIVKESGSPLLRQVSNDNNNNIVKKAVAEVSTEIPDDIEIDTSHFLPSNTTPSENTKNSYFFDSGNRAPSPLSFRQQTTEGTASDQDAAFSFESLVTDEVAVSDVKNFQQSIFEEVDDKFYGEVMSIMQSNEPAHSMNIYDSMPAADSLEAYLNDQFSDDSVQGSTGVVSNSASSISSSYNLDGQWGSDSDIEDCLLLGMDDDLISTFR